MCFLLCVFRPDQADAGQIGTPYTTSVSTSVANETSQPFIIHDEMSGVELDRDVELFEDKSGKLSIEEISSSDYSGRFLLPGEEALNLGFSSSAWWVRVTFVNRSERDKTAILRQRYPLIDYLDLWERDNSNGWKLHRTGDQHPFSQRDIEFRDFLFAIDIPANSRATHYLRFKTKGPVDIKLSLYSPFQLIKTLGLEQLAYGIYYGGFLVLLIYNLLIFLAVRGKVFLYYLWYVMSYGFYMGAHNGLTFQYLWPNYPDWGNTVLLLLLVLSLFWALQFSRTILMIKDFSSKLEKLSLVFLGILLVTLAASFVVSYSVMIVFVSILTLLEMPLIFIMGFGRLLEGFPPARYFMLAWSALILGVIVYMLKVFGWLPHTFITENGFQIGSLIEMVLLSLALRCRVNALKRQSRTDALTSLANRRKFDHLLASEFKSAKRLGHSLSLLMIDIDHFKQFNDRFGHTKGDEVLKLVAALLDSSVRKPYLPCRFGGEEFAIILPKAGQQESAVLAERLRHQVEKESENSGKVTISVGFACFSEGSMNNVAELLDAADRALYHAKELGRNQVVDFVSLEKISELPL